MRVIGKRPGYLDLPVTFLPDTQIRGAAPGAIVGFGLLEKEYGAVTFAAREFIHEYVVIGQIDLDDLTAVMAYAREKANARVVLAYPPADKGALVAT